MRRKMHPQRRKRGAILQLPSIASFLAPMGSRAGAVPIVASACETLMGAFTILPVALVGAFNGAQADSSGRNEAGDLVSRALAERPPETAKQILGKANCICALRGWPSQWPRTIGQVATSRPRPSAQPASRATSMRTSWAFTHYRLATSLGFALAHRIPPLSGNE
jgi:hypothetical protein